MNAMAWFGAFIDAKDEDFGASGTCGGDHPFAHAKTHLSWSQIGNHNH
jgi:hypothetical protein